MTDMISCCPDTHSAHNTRPVCDCVCDSMRVEPLEDGGLGLGVHSETDGFFHGAVDERLGDAALLTAGGFLLCVGQSAVLGFRGRGRGHSGTQPAITLWKERRETGNT